MYSGSLLLKSGMSISMIHMHQLSISDCCAFTISPLNDGTLLVNLFNDSFRAIGNSQSLNSIAIP